jgi:hypothetical protein
MKCVLCKRALKPEQRVVPVMTVVGNEKRGDFVAHTAEAYIHLTCIRKAQP